MDRQMPRTFTVVMLLVGLSGLGAADLKELGKTAMESVVLLRMYDSSGQEIGTGTGFAAPGGYLVTNYHVIERASRVEAVLADGNSHAVAGIITSDRDNDLALLLLRAVKLPALPLAIGTEVEPGERVVVLGNPLGLSGTLSEGIVSAFRKDGLTVDGNRETSQPLLQITAPISPGSSGSPVMNMNGEVIGVVVSLLRAGQSLNFAVPVAAVTRLLVNADADRLEQRLATGGPATIAAYGRNLAISILFFLLILVGFRRLKDHP